MADTKLTLADVINECPLIEELHSELSDEEIAQASRWFKWLRDRVATDAWAEKHAEIARLKAELAAATQAKPVPTPKPRRTGGQHVRDWLENHIGHLDHRINDEAFEAFAKEHGIRDDPEPPTDGELMRRASEASDGGTSAYWSLCAAEFLRLRAERDGGEA